MIVEYIKKILAWVVLGWLAAGALTRLYAVSLQRRREQAWKWREFLSRARWAHAREVAIYLNRRDSFSAPICPGG